MREFKNEPLTNFKDKKNAEAMQAAVDLVRRQLGRTYPLIIGDREYKDGPTFDSINPARPDEVVGRFPKATVEQAREAIEAADKAFATWSQVSPEERAAKLF